MEDKALLKGLRTSDIACYEVLIDQYTPYITRVVIKVGQGRLTKEDMEEVCADVFIKVWQKRKQLDIKEGYLKSYLGAMARNNTLNKMRGKGIQDYLPLEEDLISYDTPEKKIVTREESERIHAIIKAFPEPDREIFIRRYFYFEKLSSIAEAIGIPMGTVGTKLARGKKKLEQSLKERGVAYE